MYIMNDIAYGNNFNNKEIKIENVKIIAELCLLITFSNGEKRIFDAKELLKYPAYEKLNDDKIFKDISIENGTLVWDNGKIDIAPETVYNSSYEYEEESVI